jgi:hypothetical protein
VSSGMELKSNVVKTYLVGLKFCVMYGLKKE